MKQTTQSADKVEKAPKSEALLFVAVCQVLGFLASYVGGVTKKQPWYDDTRKPAIWPPQWVFPLVWIANYTFMGLATWHVWRKRDERAARQSLSVFAVHLLHNLAFIPVVYSLKKRSVYVGMDTVGTLLVAATTRSYSRVSRPATLLMLPYLGWCCFTTFIKVLWWRIEQFDLTK